MAFSTGDGRVGAGPRRKFQSALRMRGLFNHQSATSGGREFPVSIRLADAWPFQPSSGHAARVASPGFQSALRMRGLFNRARPTRGARAVDWFQSALRMRGLFNVVEIPKGTVVVIGFNPPCGCVAFSTEQGTELLEGVEEFQSALRMRGLFNAVIGHERPPIQKVSIRLADAWPFQPDADTLRRS